MLCGGFAGRDVEKERLDNASKTRPMDSTDLLYDTVIRKVLSTSGWSW
jgi:hypothetical protein